MLVRELVLGIGLIKPGEFGSGTAHPKPDCHLRFGKLFDALLFSLSKDGLGSRCADSCNTQ
jgi:hypothetical protein